MQFSILRKQLKGLGRLAATKDIRYYLNGLHVVQNNRGTYIEATNGHMLGRLLIDETPVATPGSVILPLESVKSLAATGKKGNEIFKNDKIFNAWNSFVVENKNVLNQSSNYTLSLSGDP